MQSLIEALQHPQKTLLDVRTPEEFQEYHIAGAINIPLNEIPYKTEEIENMSKPLIVFCKAGGRSANACAYLSELGVEDLYNGGGIHDVEALLAR